MLAVVRDDGAATDLNLGENTADANTSGKRFTVKVDDVCEVSCGLPGVGQDDTVLDGLNPPERARRATRASKNDPALLALKLI